MKTLTFYSIADLQAALTEAEKYHAVYEANENKLSRMGLSVTKKTWQEVYAAFLFETEGAEVTGQHTVIISPLPQADGFSTSADLYDVFRPITSADVWAGDSEDIEDELDYYRRH